MSENHTVEGLMSVTMQKIKEMVDVNTIIGDPITTPDGTVIIPVSKVAYGFAAGGSDIPTKSAIESSKQVFGGGSGAGVSINPIGFIVVSQGQTQFLSVDGSSDPMGKFFESIPGVVTTISNAIKSKKNNTDSSTQDDE